VVSPSQHDRLTSFFRFPLPLMKISVTSPLLAARKILLGPTQGSCFAEAKRSCSPPGNHDGGCSPLPFFSGARALDGFEAARRLFFFSSPYSSSRWVSFLFPFYNPELQFFLHGVFPAGDQKSPPPGTPSFEFLFSLNEGGPLPPPI